MQNKKTSKILYYLTLVLKGVVVGFGAIMPGISGGTLCVAFGMYSIIIDLLAHPFKSLKQHGLKVFIFAVGVGIGFVGLSGLANYLMTINSQAVTCAFVGFIIGTTPSLYKEAGEVERKPSSFVSMGVAFVIMLALLLLLRTNNAYTIKADVFGFLFCGIVWGISFIVPGLSSSTLLLFFGIYQPMLDGISSFSFPVLIPLAIGMVVSVLCLSKVTKIAFTKWHSILSHAILGIVIASTILIIPLEAFTKIESALLSVLLIIAGAVLSYFSEKLCAKINEENEQCER